MLLHLVYLQHETAFTAVDRMMLLSPHVSTFLLNVHEWDLNRQSMHCWPARWPYDAHNS